MYMIYAGSLQIFFFFLECVWKDERLRFNSHKIKVIVSNRQAILKEEIPAEIGINSRKATKRSFVV